MYFFKDSQKTDTPRSEREQPVPIKGQCFADKANNMILALMVFCGIVLFASTSTTLEHYKERRAQARELVGVPSAQPVGFNPCPYCRGLLDKLGRCNIRGCSLFSIYWGKAKRAKRARRRLQPQVIKEMAMEIAPVPGFEGVAVHAVYDKGWASQASLRPGDLLVKFDGRGIDNVKDFQDRVLRAAPEAPVRIEFLRGGRMRSANVMVGEGEMEGAVQPVRWRFRM